SLSAVSRLFRARGPINCGLYRLEGPRSPGPPLEWTFTAALGARSWFLPRSTTSGRSWSRKSRRHEVQHQRENTSSTRCRGNRSRGLEASARLDRAGRLSLHDSAGDLQVGELGYGVGLGPQAEPAVRERLVRMIEEQCAVQVSLDLRPECDDANRVPRSQARLRHSRGGNRAPLPIHERIEAKV